MMDTVTFRIDSEDHPVGVGVLEVLQAAALLVLARLALVAMGFRRTAAVVERLGRPAARRPVDHARVRAAKYAVSLAAALLPARILCLERSIVLYHILNRDRVPVVLRLGVRAYPFAAHAWVELEEEPINEVPERLKDFQPILEIRR